MDSLTYILTVFTFIDMFDIVNSFTLGTPKEENIQEEKLISLQPANNHISNNVPVNTELPPVGDLEATINHNTDKSVYRIQVPCQNVIL